MLDPKVFDAALNRLKVLPTQGGHEDAVEFATRKRIYFEALADMDTGRFEAACHELLRESGRVWFPTPGEIRAEAEAWQPLALPAPRRTAEEIAHGKADAVRGLELIRLEAERRGISVPQLVRDMPEAKA